MEVANLFRIVQKYLPQNFSKLKELNGKKLNRMAFKYYTNQTQNLDYRQDMFKYQSSLFAIKKRERDRITIPPKKYWQTVSEPQY